MNNKDVTITIKANASQFQAALDAVKKGMEGAVGSIKNGGSTILTFAKNASDGFSEVASGIMNVAKVAATTLVGGSFGAKYFVDLAGSLQTTQKQMAVLTGSTEAANKVFGELYNFTLGKPIAFPDASKAASTLLGYGRSVQTVQRDMETLSKLSIVNGGDLQHLAVVYGQVTSRGALFGQDALQLINNNIPLTTILAKKFGISMQEASERINGGVVSADEFIDAMQGYADSLDISSMSDSFKNKMISLQGTIRSVGLAILGVRVDSQKGLIIDQSGLFSKVIKLIESFTGWLKTNKQSIIDVSNVVINNLVPGLTALAAAFAVMKLGQFAVGIISVVSGFKQFTIALQAGKGAMAAMNAVTAVNPFVIIAAAIAAVIAVLVFLQVKFDWIGKTVSAVGAAFNWVKGVFNDVVKSFNGFKTDAIDKFHGAIQAVSDAFTKAKTIVEEFVRSSIDTLTKAYNTAKDAVVRFVTSALNWFGDRISEITAWVDKHQVALRNWAIVIGTLLLPMLMKLAVQAAVAAGQVIASWAVAAAGATQSFAKMAISAAIESAKAAANWTVSAAKTVASFVVTSYSATVNAAKAGAAWVKNAAVSSYAWVTQELPKIIAGFAKASLAAAINAAKMGAAFVQQAALTTAGWAKSFAMFAVGMAKMVAQFLVQAVRMAAGWLLAMGPIGLIVALIVGVVALIINNWETVKQWFAAFWAWLMSALQVVGDFFTGVWRGLQAAVGAVIDWVKQNWPLLLAILTGPIGLAVLWIVNNWETVKAAFALAWQFIQGVWGNVVGFFGGVWNGIVSVFSGVGGWFAGIFTNAVNVIRNAWGGMTGFFQGIWNGIVSIFGSIGAAVSNGIVGAVRGVVNGILSGAEGIVNGFVGAINGVIGTINRIPGVNIGKLGTLHLPRLATGGIVPATAGGRDITVAEGGQDEWVVPESKMASLVSQVLARVANPGRGSGNGNPVVQIMGSIIEKIVIEGGANNFTDADAIDIAKRIVRALRAQGLDIEDMGELR